MNSPHRAELQRGYVKKYYENNKVKALDDQIETKKRYLQTPQGKAVKKASRSRMRELYPEKFKAREIARNAMASGKLIKKPCEVCGNVAVEGHHDDYSKPLEVRWFCHQHHCEMEGRWITRN